MWNLIRMWFIHSCESQRLAAGIPLRASAYGLRGGLKLSDETGCQYQGLCGCVESDAFINNSNNDKVYLYGTYQNQLLQSALQDRQEQKYNMTLILYI